MTYRERHEVVELELDEETAGKLDRVAQCSDGRLDRSGAARLALDHGLEEVLREAELHASRHLAVCPRCNNRGMFPAAAGELLLQGCGACGGVWLDDASSRHLIAQPSAEAAHLATLAANNAQRPVSVQGPVSCPVCSETLRHHDFPNAKLRLDVCARHGTWFDRGELSVLVALVQEELRRRAELEQAIRSASVDAEIRQVNDIYAAGFTEGQARGRRFRW